MNPITETMIFQSDSMEPAIDFGDEIAIAPTRGVEADGMYMLHYQRERMAPPSLMGLLAPVVKVVRRVRRLDDGRLHLSYDGPGYQCDEVVAEDDLQRWCTIVGLVSVAQRNGRGFSTGPGRDAPQRPVAALACTSSSTHPVAAAVCA